MNTQIAFIMFATLLTIPAQAMSENATYAVRLQDNGFLILKHMGDIGRNFSLSRDFPDNTKEQRDAYNAKIDRAFANVPYWVIDFTFLKDNPKRNNPFYGVMYDFTIAQFSAYLEKILNNKLCQDAGIAYKGFLAKRDDIAPRLFREQSVEEEARLVQACVSVK